MTYKSVPKNLLDTLSDGAFHSGEDLGEAMGVSRAAIWKNLQKLEQLGLSVESIRGKGYRLEQRIDFLFEDVISQALQSLEAKPELHFYGVLDSTNAELLRRLNNHDQWQKLNNGLCIIAEMQEAGKGRRGRQWHSPFGQNLYFSMLWRFEQGMTTLDGLSLVVGLCFVKALKKVATQQYQLKWPNDLLFEGKKVAGILLEVVGDPTGVCHVVIGIGVNVNSSKDKISRTIDQAWSSLADIEGVPLDRNTLLAETIKTLMEALPRFERLGFAAFMDEWSQYDAFKGQEVFVKLGDNSIFGLADGVTKSGELRLKNEQGVQFFNGGEVSLRRSL